MRKTQFIIPDKRICFFFMDVSGYYNQWEKQQGSFTQFIIPDKRICFVFDIVLQKKKFVTSWNIGPQM